MADVNVRITAQDKASATINSVSNSLGGFGKQVGTVQQAVNALATGSIPGLSSSLSGLTRIISGGPWGLLAGAAAAAGGALVTMGIQAANVAEQLENMSAITGLATSDLEALQRMAEDAGLGTETLATSIGNLNRQLAAGEGGDFAKVLSALKGSVRDSSGQIKDAITVLDDLRVRLIAIESPTLRAQLANAALGKGLRELIPLLLNSDKSMREQIEAMKESGRVMDAVTQKNLLALDKALDGLAADTDRLSVSMRSLIGATFDWFETIRNAPSQVWQYLSTLRALGSGRMLGPIPGGPPSAPKPPPAAPGESPTEILEAQEARARAIASGAIGKELELRLKIEDAERRMKAVHGEKQIVIANEIAGYKRQLDLLREQTKELEAQKGKLEEINAEGRRREAMAKLPVTRESEVLAAQVAGAGPTLFAPGEAAERAEKLVQDVEDMRFQAHEREKKFREDFYDWELDRSRDTQKKIEDMRQDAIREQKRQYERMIDSIRDAAGQIFDAMLTKGESVFSSLARFAEGVLQTMLRNVFQNAIQVLAQSSGVFQRLLGGGGGGGGAGGAAAMAGGFGGLIPLFGRGGGAAAAGGYAQSGGITYAAGGAAKVGGFATTAAGSALTAGGAIAGQMLAMDAFRRGSAIEGLAGGAMAGASIGTMIAPGVGTAIGAGVGAIAGLITGLFGGGAKRRAEEAARRAAMLEAQQFQAPETITRYGVWGAPGEYAVEPDLTGRIRGIGRVPSVVVNVENNMIDAKHAREAGEVIGQVVSQQILSGGNYLAANIGWAAS